MDGIFPVFLQFFGSLCHLFGFVRIHHADAMEIPRHALSIDLQFYLGFWIVLILILDVLPEKILNEGKNEIKN